MGNVIGKVMPDTRIGEFQTGLEERVPVGLGDIVITGTGDAAIFARVIEVQGDTKSQRTAVCRPLKLERLPAVPEDSVRLASDEEVQRALHHGDGSKDGHGGPLTIGTLLSGTATPIGLDPLEAISKHVAILAMTGAGKTFACSILLQRLMERGYPVIAFDLHRDYVNADVGITYDGNKKYKMKILKGRPNLSKLSAKEFTILSTILSEEDVTPTQQKAYKEVHEKHPKEDSLEFIEEAVGHVDQRSAGPIDRQAEKIAEEWEDVAGLPSWEVSDLLKSLKRGQGIVFDLQALSLPWTQFLVYLVTARAFKQRKKGDIPPLFLLIEEAHNFIPAPGPASLTSSGEKPWLYEIRRIAREGRKFGLGLGLVSQRPSQIDPTVLSQCNTQIILRITNPTDQAQIKRMAEQLDDDLGAKLSLLQTGQAIVCGSAVKSACIVNVDKRRGFPEGRAQTNFFQDLKDNW